MKKNKIITILLIALCQVSIAKTIIVHSKKDKRYIAYLDSLRAWSDNEKMKKSDIAKLDAARNLNEYIKISKELGYASTDKPLTKDKNYMYESAKKSKRRK